MTTEVRASAEAQKMATRVLKQVMRGLDKDRLLPSTEKRRRDLAKKLDREMERNGWRIFVSAQAHAMLNGKAPARRNAEVMLVQTVRRWYDDIVELMPERLPDLERLVRYGCEYPAPAPNRD